MYELLFSVRCKCIVKGPTINRYDKTSFTMKGSGMYTLLSVDGLVVKAKFQDGVDKSSIDYLTIQDAVYETKLLRDARVMVDDKLQIITTTPSKYGSGMFSKVKDGITASWNIDGDTVRVHWSDDYAEITYSGSNPSGLCIDQDSSQWREDVPESICSVDGHIVYGHDNTKFTVMDRGMYTLLSVNGIVVKAKFQDEVDKSSIDYLTIKESLYETKLLRDARITVDDKLQIITTTPFKYGSGTFSKVNDGITASWNIDGDTVTIHWSDEYAYITYSGLESRILPLRMKSVTFEH
ncbi:uncharacterized protein [Antennarius striatus]|uniref:uncharacterized protein n=1 Tax=Antennarius striatus TaxID=241820 RepID=UPI0035B2AC53